MRRQRQLHQNAINFVAMIQHIDHLQQFSCGNRIWRSQILTEHSKLLAGFDLVTHVNL